MSVCDIFNKHLKIALNQAVMYFIIVQIKGLTQ